MKAIRILCHIRIFECVLQTPEGNFVFLFYPSSASFNSLLWLSFYYFFLTSKLNCTFEISCVFLVYSLERLLSLQIYSLFSKFQNGEFHHSEMWGRRLLLTNNDEDLERSINWNELKAWLKWFILHSSLIGLISNVTNRWKCGCVNLIFSFVITIKLPR